MAAAAFCVAGWASGDVPSDPSREFLLPSGTLKAFAEYIPAYGKGAVPGPEGTEPVRLEQAIDATRAAKDARALKEAAAALDAYWQSRLDALYAPVAAWLASRWFVKSELIEHQSKWFKEMPLQELQDEIVMESWVQAQVAWEAFLRADERFYRAWMLADQNRRSAMKGEGVPDAGSLGELEEAEVHVRRAFKKMERMMAIADTACATNAYPLVDVAPVDPGWQENDPVLQKVEQAVCSSEYPFVKFLLGSYRNYWKARLSGIRTAFLPENGCSFMRTGWEDRLREADRAWRRYVVFSVEYEIQPGIYFWSSGIGIYMTAHESWLYRQRCRDLLAVAGLVPERRSEGFTSPARNFAGFGEANLIAERIAAAGGSSAAAYRKLSENLERLRTDLFSSVSPWPAVFLAVETGDESMLRFLMSRLRLSGEDMLPGGTTTPLMKAVASRSVPLADILVSCRELLNAVDARGRTALDMALERGDGEMAALLRRHGGITGEERKKEREHSSPSSPPAYD